MLSGFVAHRTLSVVPLMSRVARHLSRNEIIVKLPFQVPLAFARAEHEPRWPHVRRGLEIHAITLEDVLRFAEQRAKLGDPCAVQVAESARTDWTGLIELLAGQRSALSDRYWLFVSLAWVWANEPGVEAAFGLVEQLYAAFDYPTEVESFVPYMPMRGPDLGSVAANRERMRSRWRDYLEGERAFFAGVDEPSAE